MKRLLLLLVLSPCFAFAEQPKTLDQLQHEERAESALSKLNELAAQMDTMTKQREMDCVKAIGYQPFCGCIMEDLPVAWSFSDYVSITTRTKEQNGYAKMAKDWQQAYDKVPPIRDKCVRIVNAKP